MAFRLNQGGEAATTEADPGKKMEGLKPREEAVDNKGPRFQERKGSVFPAKKKLVKTMMLKCVAESLSSLSISHKKASSSSKMGGLGSSKINPTPPTSSKANKTMEIFPEA